MALLFMDGFDAGDTATKWSSVPSGTSDVASRFGTGRSFRVPYGSFSPKKIFGSQITKVIVGFSFTASNAGNTSPFFHIWGDSGATLHLTLSWHQGTQLQLRRGNWGDTLIATGNYNLTGWHYVEISATISTTVGTCDVRVDGQTIISFSGNTKNGGTNDSIDAISGGLVFSGVSYNYYDDLYVLDGTGPAPYNNFLGDVRVYTTAPSGAGATTQFTPSAGSNFQTVDELPYSATDYNTGTAPGLKDTYAMGDIPAAVNNVYAVGTNVIAKKTDAGSIAVRPVIRSGGTDYSGSPTVMTANDVTVTDLRTVDPATSAAWTAGGVNSLEGGMEIV